MSNNRINTVIASEDMKAITTAFDTINQRLNFAVNLTDAEKQSLLRLSDKNRMFLRKMLDALDRHPDVLPSRFDVNEFRNDVELHFQLAQLLQTTRLLAETIEDTYRLSGSEAYLSALTAYKYLQAANATSGELDAEVDELGKLFVRKLSTVAKTA